MNYPMRSNSHVTDEKAIALIKETLIDSWVVRDPEGRDYGIDLQLERFDEGYPTGDFIFAQVKGTEKEFDHEVKLQNFPVKTINYALLFSVPFFVFYTSVKSKTTKFIWLQKYAEINLDIHKPKWREQSTVTINFPIENDIDLNVEKIISISNFERKVKVAHKYVMLYERYYEFFKKLKAGEYDAAKVCNGLLCSMLKIRCFEEFGGDFLLGPDKNHIKTSIIMCSWIFGKAMETKSIKSDELQRLEILNQSLKFCKLEAVNIELRENIANWINETSAY
ncbi:DUF4365 domain-containing protein [Vibrio cholerae]|nr:DUF4365 domain-containing protein [Vibrio cholerae]